MSTTTPIQGPKISLGVTTSHAVESIARRSRAQVALVLVVVVAFAPLLGLQAYQLWQRPHYQFFPLVLVSAAVLLWTRRAEWTQPTPQRSVGALWLYAAGWCLLALAIFIFSPWLAALGAYATVAALVTHLGGFRGLKNTLPIFLFLALVIPLPIYFDQRLVSSLQDLASVLSSKLLDLFRIIHVRRGNIVEIPGRELFVEGPCSGIQSLHAVAACTMLYLLCVRAGALRWCALLTAGFLWVLLANLARVVMIAAFGSSRSVDWSTGWRHEVIGWVLFTLALAFLWSTDRLLHFFTVARGAERPRALSPSRGELPQVSAALLPPRRGGVILGLCAFAALALVQLTFLSLASVQSTYFGVATIHAGLDPLHLESLPVEIEGWRRIDFAQNERGSGDILGEWSRTWVYERQGSRDRVAVDYAYFGWHELPYCYVSQGWTILHRHDVGAGSATDREPPGSVFVRYRKSVDRFGYLWYSVFDPNGELLLPPSFSFHRATLSRIANSLRRWTGSSEGPCPGHTDVATFQLQLFFDRSAPFSPAEEDQAAAFFRAVRTQLQELYRPN